MTHLDKKTAIAKFKELYELVAEAAGGDGEPPKGEDLLITMDFYTGDPSSGQSDIRTLPLDEAIRTFMDSFSQYLASTIVPRLSTLESKVAALENPEA